MNDILTAMIAITPITVGITQGAKIVIGKALDVDRFAPVIALTAGVGASFTFPPAMSTSNEFAAGILAGLAASGLYSATKTTVMGR